VPIKDLKRMVIDVDGNTSINPTGLREILRAGSHAVSTRPDAGSLEERTRRKEHDREALIDSAGMVFEREWSGYLRLSGSIKVFVY